MPTHIPRPDYALHPQGVSLEEKDAKRSGQIKVLDDEEIEGLKLACRLGRECLDEAAKAIAPGVTTDEIDRVVHEVRYLLYYYFYIIFNVVYAFLRLIDHYPHQIKRNVCFSVEK